MSTEAEEVRFKEQQKSIESALKELSISSRIHQEQEHEKLISYRQKCTRPTSLSTIDFDQLNTHYILNTANTEFSTPYDPISIYSYDQINYGSETPDSQRERTPSMISSSSYISNRSSQLDDPYSHPNYHVSERYSNTKPGFYLTNLYELETIMDSNVLYGSNLQNFSNSNKNTKKAKRSSLEDGINYF